MSLKSKAVLIFLGIFVVYGATDYVVQQFVVLPSFIALEQNEAQKDLERAVEAIKREVHYLNTFCWDWSAWDDTYAFMISRSKKYIESNLVLDTFTDNGINLIYFIDRGGEAIWGKVYDLKAEKPIKLPGFQKGPFQGSHSLIPKQEQTGELSQISTSGIVATEKGPMLVAARPILTSENKGASRGTLIMGRFLNDDLVKTLEDQSKVVFSIHPAGLNPSHEQGTEIHSNGTSENTYRLEKQGPSHLLVSTTLPDVEGNPVFLITANIPRTISAKGYDTIRYAVISGFVLMLLALIIMLFVLQGTILRHISKLTNHALSIRRTGDLSTRLSIRRRDEIGALSVEFDKMVEKLEKQTDELTELNEELKKDISRRIQVEEALRESEEKLFRSKKMEAMGLMAGGVAHDLNNILSGIVSYPELLLMNLPEDSPLRKPLKTIQESGMRAADVVEDLMTIARGVASSKEVLNLDTVVEEYQKSVEHQKLERTYSSLNFKTELDPELLNMSGSLIHIRKILMNLVSNASEAIDGSGTVTISTMNQYLDQPLKGYEEVRMGEYVVLTVSDDGSGISPEDLERIFEPFYTKKVMGLSGTGLGLAVVWNTVQDHNGYINVGSSDKGTEFQLYFPVTREEVAVEKEAVPLDDYMGNEETILVVDDEERQREIASGMLSNLGYNVEAVSSGEEAVEYVKEHPVNLIVLDMVMPKGINGRETYEEIIKIRRGQKAIIASGYARTKEVDTAQALGAGKYIKKPYTLEKIGVAVKEELEK